MAILTTLDTFSVSGAATQTGTGTTTNGRLSNVTVTFVWTPSGSSSGNLSLPIDFFLSDGTWVDGSIVFGATAIPTGSPTNGCFKLFADNTNQVFLMQGVRSRLISLAGANGTLKVQLRMED